MQDGPWFRRVGLSYYPVTLAGWVATALLFLVEIPAFQLMSRMQSGTLMWWLIAAFAGAVFVGFMALVLTKTKAR